MSNSAAAFARLDAFAEERRRAFNTPGLALAMTDRSGLLHAAGFGFADIALRTPVTPETVFAIGSMGKAFTAIALLREHEGGRLDLDAPVTRYLPWVRAGSEYDPITIHHLLTHTGGLIASSDATPDARSEVWT